MRTRVYVWLTVLVIGVVGSATVRGGADAPVDKALLGTWTGTWEGAGSGGFELVLEQTKEGAPSGKVSVTGEPTYEATLKTLSFDHHKMSATYDFPPDDRMEVALSATFDGGTAKGTWSARGKNGGGEVFAGTWTVTKK